MKMSLSRSLVGQMIVLVFLLLILPISTAGYYLYSQITSDLTQMEKERVHISSQASQSLIEKMGDNLLGVTKTNSHWGDNRIAVANNDINWINENINCGIDIIPNVDFISTSDFNGKVISQAGNVNEFTGNLAYPGIIEQLKKKSDFSGLVQTSKGLAIIAVSKITDEEGTAEPTGILIFGRLLDNKALGEIKDTLQDNLAILSNTGTFLSTSNKLTEENLKKYLHKRATVNISTASSIESAQMVTSLNDFSNKSIGIIYVDQKQITSTIVKSKLINVNLVIGIILFIILVILSLLIYRRVIIPIRQLVFISEDVSKGILVHEVKKKVSNRNDELGKLGNSMNVMIQNFRNLIREVAEKIELVASSSEELSTSSEETTNATHQIVSAIQEVANGSETQLQGATESAKAMEEMALGIQQIAETISVVTADSAKTELEAEQGHQSIRIAVQQMENINESFKESVSVVNQLSERSKEIQQIASLITNIADQTNLLALNAAIESARAGEHGRGFAVVADEVRKLAEQTATSAKQVSELIGVIQNESISTVQSMDHVNIEIHEGLQQIHKIGGVFERILLAAQNVAHQTQEVSAISEEMSASTEQVASSVEKMADIAKGSNDSSQNVASSSQEQLASMEMITQSSEALTKMAQELKESINQFKI